MSTILDGLIWYQKTVMSAAFHNLRKEGKKASWKNIWEHNSTMVGTDTAAWLYVINLCHQNANDSVGTLIYLEGDDTEVVSSQPRNEAWYQVANSTLASVLDDWREYMTYNDKGTVEEWEEMVRLYTRYAL